MAEISLQEFLTISDTKLDQIGIEMPFQRNTIRLGLFNFFNAKWTKNSLNVPAHLENHVSSLDLVYTLAGLLRHMVVMKCQLKYYQGLNFRLSADNAERILTLEYLHSFQESVESLKGIVGKMKPTKRPLLIEKKSTKKYLRNSVMTLTAVSTIVALCFLFKK
jgi:hypothetical protein